MAGNGGIWRIIRLESNSWASEEVSFESVRESTYGYVRENLDKGKFIMNPNTGKSIGIATILVSILSFGVGAFIGALDRRDQLRCLRRSAQSGQSREGFVVLLDVSQCDAYGLTQLTR
jgi:hypothetical protein